MGKIIIKNIYSWPYIRVCVVKNVACGQALLAPLVTTSVFCLTVSLSVTDAIHLNIITVVSTLTFKVILLGLSYDEFSWDYSHIPNSESDPECFDTFWLEFDSEEGDSTAITQLQIFSKQVKILQ